MTNLKTKLTSAFATGALLVNVVSPLAFAETNLQISGNGAGSDNAVSVSNTGSTSVNQYNNAHVMNTVTNNANTGNNDASFNTGDGNVTVVSGNVQANTMIDNRLNSNSAELGCCAAAGATNVVVDGNGAFSDNNAWVDQSNQTNVQQANNAHVNNRVNNNLNTGDNDAGFNTGDGAITVVSGHAAANTALSTAANANVVSMSPAAGQGTSGSNLWITGNGAGSDNEIAISMPNSVSLSQWNNAHVMNDVWNNANTGNNDASFNTGDGFVGIDSGNIWANTMVDNMVNFNGADLDCGCVLHGGLNAKISGNGASVRKGFDSMSQNRISAVLGSTQDYEQGNNGYLSNMLGGNFSTGDNETSFNTQGYGHADPAVYGGNVMSHTSVMNESNSNMIGSSAFPWSLKLPKVQTSWNMGAMMHFFGMWM